MTSLREYRDPWHGALNWFPVGGPREPVYAFLRDHGYTVAPFSDKQWARHDGQTLYLYGAGSMAVVRDANGAVIANVALDQAVNL